MPSDFGEYPAQIFPDNQFFQNLQYKMHPKFWASIVAKNPHGLSSSEWPEILTHSGLQDQWQLLSLRRMWDILH